MADPKSVRHNEDVKEKSLYDSIFSATLWLTLELALIYFITAIIIFSGLYASNVWSIQVVGLLAIFHLIAIPVAHIGVRQKQRLLLLLSLLLCSIWIILVIVYVVVFSINPFEENDFKMRSLHHLVLITYSVLDFVIVVMLCIAIINDSKSESHPKSGPNTKSKEKSLQKTLK